MDCIEAIMTRRSIRKYQEAEVRQEDLITILEAGRWAPSAGNYQPCYFVVVDDANKRKELQEAAYGQEILNTAPLVIVVCADPQRTSEYGERGMKLWCLLDCANAAQNMLLAAHALGYGSCWMGGFSESGVKKVLGLPEDFRVMALIPIGKAAEEPDPRPRRPLDEMVRRNQW